MINFLIILKKQKNKLKVISYGNSDKSDVYLIKILRNKKKLQINYQVNKYIDILNKKIKIKFFFKKYKLKN